MRESATLMHNRFRDLQDLSIFYPDFLSIDGSLMYICYQIPTMYQRGICVVSSLIENLEKKCLIDYLKEYDS